MGWLGMQWLVPDSIDDKTAAAAWVSHSLEATFVLHHLRLMAGLKFFAHFTL